MSIYIYIYIYTHTHKYNDVITTPIAVRTLRTQLTTCSCAPTSISTYTKIGGQAFLTTVCREGYPITYIKQCLHVSLSVYIYF